jgi:uncharacterized membrane protein YraQ (UPF0718 family)/copper chaperone CopZ
MQGYLIEIALHFWDVLGEMAPYLLFGFLVAGGLSVFVSRDLVERHLGGRGLLSTLKATVFGIPLPLCSCGVIPVAASLRSHGASRGATTAFLLSTPQTGVDSVLVTLSLLGPVFAVFRPVAALVEGIFGGAVVAALERKGEDAAEIPPCQGPCCTGNFESGKMRGALEYGFLTLPRDIGKAMIVGLAAAAVIAALIPDDFFTRFMGGGIVPMLVMMGVGLPIYVCATASVPVAAALIAKGVAPGAALVFLLTGPATNAAAVSTIWKIMGKRTAVVYLLIVVAAALGSGFLLDAIFEGIGASSGPHAPYELPGPVKTGSALVLVGVLGAVLVPRRSSAQAPQMQEPGGETIEFTVSGMTCSHCVDAVQRALAEQPGVRVAAVDRETGRARVSGAGLNLDTLRRAAERLGYETDDETASKGNKAKEEIR